MGRQKIDVVGGCETTFGDQPLGDKPVDTARTIFTQCDQILQLFTQLDEATSGREQPGKRCTPQRAKPRECLASGRSTRLRLPLPHDCRRRDIGQQVIVNQGDDLSWVVAPTCYP